MRADRLLSILLSLQVNRRMTAKQLAHKLEVSERTIHRDMEALGTAGIPVVAERGTGGGWMLMEGYRTNLTGLKPEEIKALFLTTPVRLLADLGLDQASEAAVIKLLAAMPSMFRANADYMRQRIHIDITGWRRPDEPVPHLTTLQEAVWQDRKLEITYNRGEDCSVERLVEPLGLVAKGSVWYLVAGVDGGIRNYRVSRIGSARLTEQNFVRPEGFDLAACWERSAVEFKTAFPRFDCLIRAQVDAIPYLYQLGRFSAVDHAGKRDEQGWQTVSLRFQFEQDAVECLMGLGARIRIIEPGDLHGKILELARKTVEFYSIKEG
jgi:predicted DNA-binding transcriptional regulator YafY